MNALLNNWVLKLASLVLAIALWSHVRGEVNPLETATFAVPLDVIAPRDRAVANSRELPRIVRVSVRAPRVRMRELKGGVAVVNPLAPEEAFPVSAKKLRARLDFTRFKGARDDVPVVASSAVEEVEILGVQPGDVMVELAPLS